MARKQLQIAGTERKTVKELDDAAEAYVEERDERMALTEKEKIAKTALIEAMKKHGVTVYRDENANPPLTVTLVPGKDNVKVTNADDGEGNDDEAA